MADSSTPPTTTAFSRPPPTSVVTGSDEVLLCGREAQLKRLEEFLGRLPECGGALLAAGAPGSGRSVLLVRAEQVARRAGIRVVHVSGWRQESDSPLALLERLLPLLPAVEAQVPRDTLYGAGGVAGAVMTAVRSATAAAPLLLVIDDLDLVDAPSAALLRTLVAAATPGSPPPGVGRLGLLASAEDSATAPWAPAVEVTPLSDAAARTLLRWRAPSLAAGVVDRLVTEAEGNPQVLVELAAVLTPAQAAGSADLPAVLPLPPRLTSVFDERLACQPLATRHLLLMVALDVSLRSDGRGSSRYTAVSRDRAGGLIRMDTDGDVRFSHPLVRLTVLACSTGQERRRAHLELADGERDEVRRAWHLASAHLGPSDDVAALLSEAARTHLQRREAAAAQAALVRAAELSTSGFARSRFYARAAYVAVAFTGALDTAEVLLVRAREAAGQEPQSLWLFVAEAHRVLQVSGNVDAAQRAISAALDRVPAADRANPETLARAMREMVANEVLARRPVSRALVTEASDGVDTLAARSLRLLASVADPTAGAPLDPAAMDAAVTELAGETDATVIARIAGAALFVDRLADCRPTLLGLESTDDGAVASAITARLLLAMDDYQAGRWSDAQRRCDEGLALSGPRRGELRGAQFQCLLGLLAAARGQTRSVRRICGQVESWALRRAVGSLVVWCHQARSLDAVGQGDYEAAVHHAHAVAASRMGSTGAAQATWSSLELVESALRTNRRSVAIAHVQAMLDDPLTPLSPRLAVVLPACRAMTSSADRAAGFFHDALTTPALASFPFEHARVRLLHGEWLRRTRARREARGELALAIELFIALGARPWVRRAEVEHAATGVASTAGRSARNDGMTTQQRHVAQLAASGLTNKEIAVRLMLSHRTVAAHLRSAFGALDVSSRAALRDALADAAPEPVGPPPGTVG